eukprot:COSAG01_NODE_954_length_12493_cov_8.138454_2_plen_104_part_00
MNRLSSTDESKIVLLTGALDGRLIGIQCEAHTYNFNYEHVDLHTYIQHTYTTLASIDQCATLLLAMRLIHTRFLHKTSPIALALFHLDITIEIEILAILNTWH